MWSDGGELRLHSIDKELLLEDKMYRSDENDSQIRKINNRTAITEICLPIDETMFQDKKASG